MKVIPQKVGNRSVVSSNRRSAGVAQKPTRRDRERQPPGRRLRSILSYVPLALKLGLAIGIGLLIFAGYRAATAASFFQIRQVEIQGTARASTDDIEAVVRREVSKTGVWQADINDLSERLKRLPWVRSAVVSRVLPDGIRVRLTERQPRAVVRLAAGRFFWVDDEAVSLGEMVPTDQMPPFFLRGWNEEPGEVGRKENVERVKRFLSLQEEWGAAGLSSRVSEVNLIDLRDVRAQLSDDDSQIEVRLGGQDFGKRLKDALNVLDQQRQTPRGQFISYVDLTQGKRAVIGFMSGAHAISDSFSAATTANRVETSKPTRIDQRSPVVARREKGNQERDAKPKQSERSIEERPRRARSTQ